MKPAEAIALLRDDPLRHIVTLKMLTAYGDAMKLHFAEDASGWALVSELPLGVFPYDAVTYGDQGTVVLVDGTSDSLKRRALQRLRSGPLVVKTYDPAVQRYARDTMRAEHRATFLSFTTQTPFSADSSVTSSAQLSKEAAKLFGSNGYTERELSHAFASGAHWFGL